MPILDLKLRHSRLLRDLVEVCAIIAAGGWALYVFLYQNTIVPSFAAPSLTFALHLRHVGDDGSLDVVRLDETIRNIGSVPVYFLAHSVTVLGTNVAARRTPATSTNLANTELYVYSSFTSPKVVYRDIVVTNLGDPRSTRGMFLEPGQELSLSREFYVPRTLFSRLQAFLVATFTKNGTDTNPTTAQISKSGIPHFVERQNNIYQIGEPAAEIDLKAE